jgi:isoleucyl-tRNA synthetase
VWFHTWYEFPTMAEEDLQSRWSALRSIRADIQKELEALRSAGSIGSSLQAEVEVHTSGDRLALLNSLGDDLRFVFITSAATVSPTTASQGERIAVKASAHAKCERCWHYRADVGRHASYPALCGRCVSNLYEQGEPRSYA